MNDTNGQTINSFQKPSLSAEIGWLNSVHPESSNTTDTSVRITQSLFFNLLPPRATIQFSIIELILPCVDAYTLLIVSIIYQ